jgi:transposase InsO family protein
MMCDLLGVSRSGLSAAAKREQSGRRAQEAEVVEQIRRAQARHKGRYGRRRMAPEVSEALGRKVNHKRVGRLMKEHGLGSRKRRPFRVRTTDSRHDHPVAPNVLERDFVATAPDQKWLADITCVPTAEGWLYVALVLDLFARKIVGWAMSESMPQELTIEALKVALGWRDPPKGVIHHSDRGSQYAAKDYRRVLKARGITVSMSRKGDCWDNAPMESVNGTFKVECVHGEHFKTRAQAKQAIVDYIGYYNTERRHSSLGNVAPAIFELRWRADNQNSARR